MPGTSALRCPLCRGRHLCTGHSWARRSPVGCRNKLWGREGQGRLQAALDFAVPPGSSPREDGRESGRVHASPCLSHCSEQNCQGTAVYPGQRGHLHGSLWAEKQHRDAGALQHVRGQLGSGTGRQGQERATMCPLCRYTPPGLPTLFAYSCLHKYFLRFGTNSDKHTVVSLRKTHCPLYSTGWFLQGSLAPGGRSCMYPSHLCTPAPGHPSTHPDTGSTCGPQILPGRGIDL